MTAALLGPRVTAGLVRVAELTNHTFVMPLLVFYATARCNSRCVSCEWWRASGTDDLTLGEVDGLAEAARELGTRVVVISGGEPLLRRDVFQVAAAFRRRAIRLHLLTSGVLLERVAEDAATVFERIVISLDASTEGLYETVRGLPALERVERGVARVRDLAPRLPITARATLHRHNYRELPALIEHALAMGLDGISFLAADLASSAFGRTPGAPPVDLALSPAQVQEFADLVERTIREQADRFETGFVTTSPGQLRRLPRYYAAVAGLSDYPPAACNAPWMSVVVEADGRVRPCFFHEPVGNIRQTPLHRLVAEHLPAFRRGLDVATNPTCRRCVCSIRTGWSGGPWQ